MGDLSIKNKKLSKKSNSFLDYKIKNTLKTIGNRLMKITKTSSSCFFKINKWIKFYFSKFHYYNLCENYILTSSFNESFNSRIKIFMTEK